MKALLFLLLPWVLLGQALAQEPTYMEAATHPAKGNHYSRLLVAEEAVLLKHAFGVSSKVAVLADAGADRDDLTDADLRLKLQVLKRDTGPIDTWRTSLVTGVSWRNEQKTSARVGLVSSLIRSRHGFNVQADLNLAEEEAKRGQLNASYLYRIHPVRYGPGTSGAWYLMTEALQTLSTGWGLERDFAGGLLYEARRWAIEFSYRQDGEEEFLGVGTRWLW